MQPFSFNDFNKHYNKFIWEHPNIKQSYWVKEDNDWDHETSRTVRRNYTLSTIRYNDERILQFYTNDDANRGRKLQPYNSHREEAYHLGLLSSNNYRSSSNTIIDALYYKANPPVYYNKNSTLKKGFWNALRRRLKSPAYRSSWVTEHMLTEAYNIITFSDTSLDREGISEKLQEHGIPSYSYYIDRFTNTIHSEGSGKRIRTRDGWIYVHRLTNLESYGYRFNQNYDIWLLPNEFFHDGNVYDRSEVSIVKCSSCENETISELIHEGVCHNCLDASFKIHNYSTRVEGMLKFKATKVRPNTVYLGCELEYETKNRNKAQIGVGKLMHGHALMKSDGSIRNGFEIVTCPATLDIHLEVFKNFFDNIPPDLKIQDNVGMHVHISRKPLSQLTIGKMTEFLNRIDNKDFITYIAGRSNNQYSQMDDKRKVTFPWLHQRGSDRYNALNLNNSNTIEIRLFATPMDYKTFAMRLQFVQALVDYCSPASVSVELKKQTHYQSFTHWLSGNRKMFPELSYHLKEYV